MRISLVLEEHTQRSLSTLGLISWCNGMGVLIHNGVRGGSNGAM